MTAFLAAVYCYNANREVVGGIHYGVRHIYRTIVNTVIFCTIFQLDLDKHRWPVIPALEHLVIYDGTACISANVF